jgi:hypothetical protein
MWERGDFVAPTMLEWKGNYGDGHLGHWARADLADFLLEYFPRKVMVDEERLAAVPECALGFLHFLASRGSLSGEALEWLEDALDVLRDEFEERARDRSNWGFAKLMMLQMQSDGADRTSTEAVEAWMADFNARPASPTTTSAVRRWDIDNEPRRSRRTARQVGRFADDPCHMSPGNDRRRDPRSPQRTLAS